MRAGTFSRIGVTLVALAATVTVARAVDAPLWRAQNNGLPIASAAIWDLTVLDDARGTVLAALDAGVYRSINHGRTWQLTLAGGDQPSEQRLVHPAGPGPVYLIRRTHMFRSDDSGATWKPIGLPTTPDAVFFIQGIAVDPTTPNGLYIAGEKSGGASAPAFVFASSPNGGDYWNTVTPPVQSPNHAFDVAADRRHPGWVFVLAADGLYRSHDHGYTWSHVGFALPDLLGSFETVTIDPVRTRTMWVSTQHDGVWRSDNSGATFAHANQGLPPWVAFDFEIGVGRVVYDGLDHERPYIATPGAGIFRWAPERTRWEPLNGNLPVESVIQSLAVEKVGAGRLFVGTFGRGVFRLDR